MKTPYCTASQHALAVLCVLIISLVFHGAFGMTGALSVDGVGTAAVYDGASILLPPSLR